MSSALSKLKSLSIMRQIDQFLFTKAKVFQNSPQYQKISESIGHIDDEQKDLVYFLSFFAICSIPLLILFFTWYSNFQASQEVSKKRELITLAQDLMIKESNLNRLRQAKAGSTKIPNASALQSRIKSAIGGGKGSQVSIPQFDSQTTESGMSQINGSIMVQGLTSNELSRLVDFLANSMKMSILSSSLNRDAGKKLIDASFDFIYISK